LILPLDPDMQLNNPRGSRIFRTGSEIAIFFAKVKKRYTKKGKESRHESPVDRMTEALPTITEREKAESA
jgi:hypothetical protein